MESFELWLSFWGHRSGTRFVQRYPTSDALRFGGNAERNLPEQWTVKWWSRSKQAAASPGLTGAAAAIITLCFDILKTP
jgi:hypothetical protein